METSFIHLGIEFLMTIVEMKLADVNINVKIHRIFFFLFFKIIFFYSIHPLFHKQFSITSVSNNSHYFLKKSRVFQKIEEKQNVY